MRHILHSLRMAQLKRKIEKNPFLGEKALDGAYLYKDGGYRLQYRIIELPAKGKKNIEWLELKRRLSPFDKELKRSERFFTKFWLYRGWINFFRLPTLLLLASAILLFYLGIIEPQMAKVERYRWVIATAMGMHPEQIEYIGGGWIEIGTKRKTVVKERPYEPMRYRINPISWLFRNDAGYVDRWQGDKYISHKVVYNETGDIWLKRGERWEHGIIGEKEITWDPPLTVRKPVQRKGKMAMEEIKVSGEEISKEEGILSIRDKK